MARPRIWLLKLVPSFRFGKLLAGVVLFSICMPLFYLGVNDKPEDSTPALFFSLVLAYIIPVFSHITNRAVEALIELKPRLDITEADYDRAMLSLQSTPAWATALQISAGAVFGFTHMSFVRGSFETVINETLGSLTGAMSMAGAMLVWITMTRVISMLMQQAFVFARLGAKSARIYLLHTASLAPFARVSISSSLAIIGALALFPLISFESGLNLREILPGAIATLGPLIGIFIIPVWPVHRRLTAMKHEQLAAVSQQLEARLDALGDNPHMAQLDELSPLLNYRREINDAHTWPFDIGNVSRMMFYLVIPPLTWIAAALMENLVDSLI